MNHTINQEIRSLAKKPPFAWQDKQILRHLRKCYPLDNNGLNKKLRTAQSIYLSICELASNCANNKFQATNHTIAKCSGVSTSTARRYLDDFIKLKILRKEYVKKDKANQANFWIILEPSLMTFASIQESIHNNEQPTKENGINIKNKGTVHNTDRPYIHNNE